MTGYGAQPNAPETIQTAIAAKENIYLRDIVFEGVDTRLAGSAQPERCPSRTGQDILVGRPKQQTLLVLLPGGKSFKRREGPRQSSYLWRRRQPESTKFYNFHKGMRAPGAGVCEGRDDEA
jgi:hypothetical protein